MVNLGCKSQASISPWQLVKLQVACGLFKKLRVSTFSTSPMCWLMKALSLQNAAGVV